MTRIWTATAALTVLLLAAGPALASSLNLAIDEGDTSPSDLQVGVPYTFSLTIPHTRLSNPFSLPRTPGLAVTGSGSDPRHSMYTFMVTPSRVGDYTIPAFNIRTDSGQSLHVNALRVHVSAQH